MPLSRYFRFRLRTLLLVMTILSPLLAWTAYSLNWIMERHRVRMETCMVEEDNRIPRPTAPGGLWLFGEQGMYGFSLHPDSKIRLAYAKSIFPEAEVLKARWSKNHDSWIMGGGE